MKNKLELISLVVILVITFAVRTYRLDFPIADWHSWRQADTAAVARNFVKSDFNLLYPQSDSLLALNDKGLDNPNRLFINEFPLYNSIVAIPYKQFGIMPSVARLVSISFATLGALFLYLLTKSLNNRITAFLALIYYAVNPYNIFYGRVIMPDPTFVSLSIISLYFCVRWVKSSRHTDAVIMAATFALATLVKPYAIFMAIPIAYWVLINRGFKILKNPSTYVLVIIAFLPITLWRYHLYLNPEGSFASRWLLNGDGIRFKGSFFRWIIFDRFNRLIFATGGFALFIYGLFKSYSNKKTSLFFVWAISVFIYITVFAKGNVNHDYYQLPIMPVGSILVAIGATSLIKEGKNNIQKLINTIMVMALFLISIAFGWFEVRGFFNINNPAIVEAGQKIDEITEKDALVIAPYQGDPAFLYQTNRYGWPIGGDIESKVKEGADYYVTTSKNDEFQTALNISGAKLIYDSDSFSIIKFEE